MKIAIARTTTTRADLLYYIVSSKYGASSTKKECLNTCTSGGLEPEAKWKIKQLIVGLVFTARMNRKDALNWKDLSPQWKKR